MSTTERQTLPDTDSKPDQSPSWRWGLLAVLAAGLLGLYLAFDIRALLAEGLDWVAGRGPAGMALFVVGYVGACVLLLPGSVLTIGAGAAFGLLRAVVLVWLGATLGATAAFLVARYLARDWVAQRVARDERFRAIDAAVAREGWKIVCLTRLSPVFPFSLQNYAYGLTGVSLRDYLGATGIGMLPGVVLYTYVGSLIGDAARVGRDTGGRTSAEWIFLTVGFIATVVVTVYVTRLARGALADRLSDQGVELIKPR